LQSQINKANSDALAAVGDALKSIVGPKAGG
jgi:hypothetical protein